jgi:hypothetical protein
MRKATKTVAIWFGVVAGIAGIMHGYYEILQGSTRPEGVVIPSIGLPCVAEQAWNACEPALTVVPNFLITGILAVILGLLVLVWSGWFIERRNGGVVLILLSVLLLLFGGGFFPPLIGIIGGIAGLSIHKPIPDKEPGAVLRFAAKLWPWPLVVFLVWVWGQIAVGYFFNDFMQSIMSFGVILILAMLPFSVYSAYGRDRFTSLPGD